MGLPRRTPLPMLAKQTETETRFVAPFSAMSVESLNVRTLELCEAFQEQYTGAAERGMCAVSSRLMLGTVRGTMPVESTSASGSLFTW